jgi:hypothetical protein
MRVVRRILGLLVVVSAACGLRAMGQAEPGESDAGPAIGDVDAGGGPPAPAEAGTDAGADADADAGFDAAGCVVEVNETFGTAIDGGVWSVLRNAQNGELPLVREVDGKNALVMIEEGQEQAHGGVWLEQTVPLGAFDVSLAVGASCPNPCGDGFTIAWFPAATDTQLADAVSGSGLGIPRALTGAAVSLDLAMNAQTGESTTPNVSILDIDGKKQPSTYDWTVSSSAVVADLVEKVNTIDVRVRGTSVTVKINGQVATQGAVTASVANGRFGLTASTGAFESDVFVRDLSAKFYRCNAP